MSKTDHLAKAKDYIAIAESGDAKLEAYAKAVVEIKAALIEDTRLTFREVNRQLGRGKEYANRLVRWFDSVPGPGHPDSPPFGGPVESEARYDRQARTILKDPERRRQAIGSLSPEEKVEVVREVSRSAAPAGRGESEAEMPDLREAVAADLTTQVAKLVHTASRIDVLLKDHGAIFKRIDGDEAGRLDDDLERAVNTIRAVRAELLKHREIEVRS